MCGYQNAARRTVIRWGGLGKMRFRLLVATVLAAALSTATWILPVSAEAQPAGTLSFNGNSQATSQVPAGWDEPSGIAGSDGQLYLASQNPNAPTGSPDTTLSQSSDGVNWQENTAYYNYLSSRSDGQTGDVTMAADRAGTIFVGRLTGELQADIDWTRDDGKTWQTANDVATLASPGAASNSPGLVDRPWIGVYSPDTNYKDTQVYLEYHDFVTSAIYIVTCSMATGALACGVRFRSRTRRPRAIRSPAESPSRRQDRLIPGACTPCGPPQIRRPTRRVAATTPSWLRSTSCTSRGRTRRPIRTAGIRFRSTSALTGVVRTVPRRPRWA
jgi:hypothetical protein